MAEASEGAGLFIASIGERDPESPSGPTGPLRGALELRPRRVVLVAAPGVEAQADRTRDRIAARLPGATVTVERLQVDDPAHLDALVPACGRLLDRVLAQSPDGESVALCASSGTPQIGLALTLAALARAPGARHFQALDPAKTDEPWREFDPDALRHHAELDAALQMLARCRFEEAAGLLERRLQSAATEVGAHRPAIAAAHAAARALERADALDPAGAFAQLQASVKGLPAEAANRLTALREWYGKAKSAPNKNPVWPAELASRAAREFAAGRVPQALVAAAIAFEAALAVRFRSSLDLDPDSLGEDELAKLPEEVRERARAFDGQYRIEGAEQRSVALAAVDAAYRAVHGDDRREKLIRRRNKLVHAAKAPAAEHVREALAFLDGLFRALGWPVPSACPSAPASLQALAGALRPAAGLGVAPGPETP